MKLDLDNYSVPLDVLGYNFIDGKKTEYRHTYLDLTEDISEEDNEKGLGVTTAKSDWTELRPHEFARKYGVSIVKTSTRIRSV